MNHCRWRVVLNRTQNGLQVPPPVVPNPEPEVSALTGTTHSTPDANAQRVVEHDHGVCVRQPRLEHVMRSEVAVHDPCGLSSEVQLHLPPRVGRQRQQPRLPEVLVEFENRQPGDCSELSRERALACPAATEDDNALHLAIVAASSNGNVPFRELLHAELGATRGRSTRFHVVIIWLNGTFGAGKTTTAAALLPMLGGFRVFDPETVGYMLAPNLTDLPVSDFQHWPAWRPLVVATALELRKQTKQDLVAPQTVLDEEYWTEIASGLRQQGETVFHVVLDADADVLRARIHQSPEAREWRLAHLDRYITARRWMLLGADLVVDTSAVSAVEAASSIAEVVAATAR